YSVTSLGDLNANGAPELAVGAPFDDDAGSNRGAAWILFMNANGTVASEAKLSDSTAGIAGALGNDDNFGSAVTGLGDLDGDGTRDNAVAALSDDDGALNAGAVYVIFLTSAGAVDAIQKISATVGGFIGVLDSGDMFGNSLVSVGDLDNDNV